MDSVQTDPNRTLALEVVRKLREAGFEALWAGGCVRDQLLGLAPKDYDVATSAHPEQVRSIFGHRRTLAMGAAFGVIAVLGAKGQSPIEVATFRRDGAYLDGRHPESVAFSTAELDAQRRDFTINGLFFDPVEERVIDYVGGQEDLQRRVIRAIRDPRERFGEDKLRMLRAVRFAATFNFEIDPATFFAIRELADQLIVVSAERIAAELRRMLVHPRRSFAVRLLKDTNLLSVVFPDAVVFKADSSNDQWSTMLGTLDHFTSPTFAIGLAILIRSICLSSVDPESKAMEIGRRLKLSNEEVGTVRHLLATEQVIRDAREIPWPKLQRVLVGEHANDLLAYCSAVSLQLDGSDDAVQYCRAKLQLPTRELNPPPLVTGDDLSESGLRPGPHFKRILDALRDAQLDKLITTRDEALALAKQIHLEITSEKPQ